MRNRIAANAGILLLAFQQLASAASAVKSDFVSESNFEGAWISGYYLGYQKDLYPVANVDFSALTHLVVGRVAPDANGGIVNPSFDIDATNGPIWAKQAVAAAHAHGVYAILMVGGAGVSTWSSAASSAHRANFVAALTGMMDNYGFDGLDLDWEPLQTADQPNLLQLAKNLRAAKPAIILTIPVGWTNANFATPDPFFASIAPWFNQINMMTYSMADSENHGWSGWQSWHSSALLGATGTTPSSVDSSASFYLSSGVPGSRLGVGIGFYGTCWSGVTAPHQSGGTTLGSDNTFSYENIMTKYYSASLHQYDATAQAPYLSSATAFGSANPKCTFLSYEDAQSVTAKGSYVLQHKLGGTIIWTIGEGHQSELPAGQQDSLLDAVKAAFRP